MTAQDETTQNTAQPPIWRIMNIKKTYERKPTETQALSGASTRLLIRETKANGINHPSQVIKTR